MDEEGIKSKQDLLERLLDRGMAMVTLDARLPGVDVPARFADEPQLRLNLSYRFGLPLEINAWGVRATLTFGGMPHECKLPWVAIYQFFSHATGDHYLFPTDVPDDLPAAGAGESAQPQPSPPKRKARFTVIPGEEAPRGEQAPPDDETPPTPPAGRPHLRRIK